MGSKFKVSRRSSHVVLPRSIESLKVSDAVQLYDPRNGSNLPQSLRNVFHSGRLSIFFTGDKTFLSFHGCASAEWIICGRATTGRLPCVWRLKGLGYVWAEQGAAGKQAGQGGGGGVMHDSWHLW